MQHPRSGAALLVSLLVTAACSRAPAPAIRLVDLFKPDAVRGAAAENVRRHPTTEWRFDGPAPTPPPTAFVATRGWEPGPGVAGLAIRDGRLVGRSTSDFPILRIERTSGLDDPDQLHAIELRMRVSAGSNVSLATRATPTVNLMEAPSLARRQPWTISSPLVPGNEFQTYTLTSLVPLNAARVRHILIRPTDAAGAAFEIESVRVVLRKEHLASVPSGVGWQGLSDIYRETLVSRAPETLRFSVTLPERPWLDLAVGTPQEEPVTFRVSVTPEGAPASPGDSVLEYTVSTPYRWERRPLDLSRFAGGRVTLSLALAAEHPGALGFWGAPVIRARGARGVTDAAGVASSARQKDPPRGILLIQADTLRADHLDAYGYERETAPFLRRLASQGVLFRNAIAQATWTKVSSASIMTSLYPSSHGVHRRNDRLPASATTLAEVYRAAGYATLSLSSVSFTGQFTNLHQGFEELHESESLPGRGGPLSSKTGRDYVDRVIEWLEVHQEGPFFVYLHMFDPHSPFEPRPPYDTSWADASTRDEHVRQRAQLGKVIEDPFMAARGMATREEMLKAGVDPPAYLAHDRAWYDGSIRGLDQELERLFERLRAAGLDQETMVVFLSDHGEEFHEHGRMWHGQSVYGELSRVPLVVRWPGGIAGGQVMDETVQLIDVMPTLLALSHLEPPPGLQGQSLAALLASGSGASAQIRPESSAWTRRPAITEKAAEEGPHPSATEAYAIVDEGWKLVHSRVRPPGRPEFELFDARRDPLDQTDVGADHPDVVQRLAKVLDGWRAMALAARLKPDSETTKGLTADQLQRLRSLGYVR